MSICASARCGRTEIEFNALVRELLPPGRIYSLENPDRCFTQFWLGVSAIFKDLEDCLCCLYANAVPCGPDYNPECDVPLPEPKCKPLGYKPKKTLLERHAANLNFPLDCVELTHDKLCEWVAGNGCRVGSLGWLKWLLEFVGLAGVTLEHDYGSKPIGCHALGKDTLCPNGPTITVTGCTLEYPPIPRLCETPATDLLGCEGPDPFCPKIEALRLKYFPAGVTLVYA